MSEFAFTPEDSVEPEESQIAFSPEEAQLSRVERRRLKKEKDVPMRFICPKCRAGETGGPISTVKKMVNVKTGELYDMRVHRQCRNCGGKMMKLNERRLTGKWVQKRAPKLFQK